jgi:hypothetical protein
MRAIAVELRGIDMAVAVDQRDHATIVADASAPETPRAGKPALLVASIGSYTRPMRGALRKTFRASRRP